jgi:hypothetical protein
MNGRRYLIGLAAVLVGLSAGVIAPLAFSSTVVQSVEIGPNEALKTLVGTSWMYSWLWSSTRPIPSDPATIRLRFPVEGKVEVVGPCGSEVGELRTVIRAESFGLPILHFIQSSDRKTLDLYNPVDRRVAATVITTKTLLLLDLSSTRSSTTKPARGCSPAG